jgi:hypothetical protein
MTAPNGLNSEGSRTPPPEFDAAYREARRKAFSQSIARLQQGSTAAATTLLKVMLDPATPASTSVRAAESILTHSAKAIEIEDVEARVAALEKAATRSQGDEGNPAADQLVGGEPDLQIERTKSLDAVLPALRRQTMDMFLVHLSGSK